MPKALDRTKQKIDVIEFRHKGNMPRGARHMNHVGPAIVTGMLDINFSC